MDAKISMKKKTKKKKLVMLMTMIQITPWKQTNEIKKKKLFNSKHFKRESKKKKKT